MRRTSQAADSRAECTIGEKLHCYDEYFVDELTAIAPSAAR